MAKLVAVALAYRVFKEAGYFYCVHVWFDRGLNLSSRFSPACF
jgi:hypothetical protein